MFNYSTGFSNAVLAHISSTILKDCVIEVYTGTRPANADAPVKGTFLGLVSVGGAGFTAGSPINALGFESTPVDGTLSKSASQLWVLNAVADGIAGWLRIKGNAVDAGSTSTTAIRIDGTIAAFGGDATIGATDSSVKAGSAYTINNCAISWAV